MEKLFHYRRWIYLALAVVLGVDGAVFFGWIRNPDLVADADPAQVARLEREVDGLRSEVARLERIEKSVPQMGTKSDEFVGERFLDDGDGYRRLAEDLNRAAREAGVNLAQLKGEESEEKERADLKRIQMNSTVEGNYANLLRFVNVLERIPRLYLLTEMNLVEAEGGRIRVEIQLVTFFRRARA